MPRSWLTVVLDRIRNLGAQGKVRFTLKALQELAALDLGLDEEDGRQVVSTLSAKDFTELLMSRQTGEWMYVFGPTLAETVVYLKLIVRTDCVVVSFHEDEDQNHEANQ
jgi:hypothetical protein